MSLDLTYSSAQVTKALMRLAVENGDVVTVAGELIDDEFQVPADTLRYWMFELHKEQYKRLETEVGLTHERQAIARARQTIARAAEIEATMLEAVGDIKQQALLPNALRAVADSKAKATTGLLQLTGRPVSGAQEGGVQAMNTLIRHMMDRGLLKPVAQVADSIDGTVVEEAASDASV